MCRPSKLIYIYRWKTINLYFFNIIISKFEWDDGFGNEYFWSLEKRNLNA